LEGHCLNDCALIRPETALAGVARWSRGFTTLLLLIRSAAPGPFFFLATSGIVARCLGGFGGELGGVGFTDLLLKLSREEGR
jgi:hypothetical protein